MGGSGSGRWYRWNKKTTVEETRRIESARWMREGILVPDARQFGSWAWSNAYTGEQTASIGYEVDTTKLPYTLRLFYTITPYNGKPQSYDYKIILVRTRPHFGGLRWWFVCPLSCNGRGCYRRVGKLYLPPGGSYYGCRHCYDLTYQSSQESDKRVSRLLHDPAAFLAAQRQAIDSDPIATYKQSTAELMLLLKAYSKLGRG